MSNTAWLEGYRADIIALEQMASELLPTEGNEGIDALLEQARVIVAPIEDGTIDPSDIETIREGWWEAFGPRQIEQAMREAAIQRRLAPLYERLASASEEEQKAYARMLLDARISEDSPMLHMLIDFRRTDPAPPPHA